MKKRKESGKLIGLAEELVLFGKTAGADEVEITIADGSEFSVDVRMQNIENLIEAGSRYAGIRVIKDRKTAFATSSDLSKNALHHLIKKSVKRAMYSSQDEFSGLPPFSPQKVDTASLNLYDPEISALDSKTKIALALETERIALEDKRITNSHGASFVTNEVKWILANSNGFLSEYDQTCCSLSIGLQAGEVDHIVEDFWFSSRRFFRELEKPEVIAGTVVARTVRQLNARKIRTRRVPVIFEPMMTSSLLGFLFSCVSGVSVYQEASFLAGKLDERIGNENVTVFDDGLMPGLLGTRPFDSEGVPCRRTLVVDAGILRNYLCNTYAARKLKLGSTGNADGIGVGPNNFYLAAGAWAPEDIIASTEKGFLLTRTLGHGMNPVTGEISQGAFGLWIEKGEIIHPVSEVTVSGNLADILHNIEMVGNDLEFRGPVAGPTIKVGEMTVAGE